MKYLLFLFSLLLFFSCKNSDNTDLDADIITDNDAFVETAETENEDEIDELNDDDYDLAKENKITFLTRPHGITRWNEKYSYFIRCESDKNLETTISVSEDDTCKGIIDSDTYLFIPTEEKFPDGRCIMAINCSDGENSIKQKTEILIPNPYKFIPEPVEEPIAIYSLWSNAEYAVFSHNSGIYSINRNFDNLEVIEKDGVDYLQSFVFSPVFPANKGFYYISKDGFIFTDGTVANKKIILPMKKMEEVFDPLTELLFPESIDSEDNIIFVIGNSDLGQKTTWFYSSSEDNFFIIDDEDNWLSTDGSPDDLIYERKKGEYSFFNKEEKSFVEICPDKTKERPFAKAYINGRIFYQYGYDKCLTSLNISTCEEDKICGCESGSLSIINEKNNSFFHILNQCENKTIITIYSSGKPEITTEFDGNISEFGTSDGTTLFVVEPPDSFDKSYNCLKILNMESGTVTKADVLCNPGESYAFSGFLGEKALFNVSGETLEHKLLTVTGDGKFKDVNPDMMLAPSVVYVSAGKKYRNGNDQIFVGTRGYTQCFETDGNPENIKFIAKSTGNIFSVNEDTVMSLYKFGSYQYLNSFKIANGEKTIAAIGLDCENDRGIRFEGFYDYNININGMSLFGITNAENCGHYSLWTSDGTLDGTIDHEITIYHENQSYIYLPYDTFPDQTGGFYYGPSRYIENSLKKAISTGVYGTVLGFIGDKLIVYSTDDDYISKITALQEGKVVGSFINETSRKLLEISITGNTIQLLETYEDDEPNTFLISFPDGDLSTEPLSTLLFNRRFTNVSKVAANDKMAVFSAEVKGTLEKTIKSVLLTKEKITVSEPLYYFSKDSSFSGLTVLDQDILFSENNMLMSIPFDMFSKEAFTLFETEGNFEYNGESFLKEAVIEYWVNNDDGDGYILVTDGKNIRATQRKYQYSDISIWNDLIVESGKRFVVEKDSDTLEPIDLIGENSENDSYATKSLQNIFLHVRDESDTYYDNSYYYIYHLPEKK